MSQKPGVATGPGGSFHRDFKNPGSHPDRPFGPHNSLRCVACELPSENVHLGSIGAGRLLTRLRGPLCVHVVGVRRADMVSRPRSCHGPRCACSSITLTAAPGVRSGAFYARRIVSLIAVIEAVGRWRLVGVLREYDEIAGRNVAQRPKSHTLCMKSGRPNACTAEWYSSPRKPTK